MHTPLNIRGGRLTKTRPEGRGYSGGLSQRQMILRGVVSGAQKMCRRAKKAGISRGFPALGTARGDRKTVGKTPPPRHKKFLANRETHRRQMLFHFLPQRVIHPRRSPS